MINLIHVLWFFKRSNVFFFISKYTCIIHILYYRINHRLGWLTCWRSNWLKISNKIIQIILLFIPRPILRLFPHHKLQQTKLLLDVVVDESCIGFLIQKLITSNLFVSLSLSLSRPTKSSFQRERFSFFFFPPTIQIRLSGRKTIEEALETISFDPKFHDSLARRHLASCLSDLKIITSGDNSRPVSWGYMTCARACTRELREM